ncbi:MAG TPA: DUF2254 domain-containing protein [Gemmatimonadaceae bacterium]
MSTRRPAWGRPRLLWERLISSLWFVPGVMLFLAGALAVAIVEVSTLVDREALIRYPRLFGAGAQSSRDMLSTIASAMMTVAGVTFSITVLAVAQASSQYTPRILRNFMRDRANQVTLGTLSGVFVYCLVVIRTVRGDEELRFIPSLAVLMAFVLAIAAIGVLIYFIHHIAESLGATHVLARVREDTVAAIDRLFPEGVGEEDAAAPALPAGPWTPVPAGRTGYVSHVDAGALLARAAAARVVLRMERGVGDHVVEGTPLVSWAGGDDGSAARLDGAGIRGCFTIAAVRTIDQDAEFGVRQMVDIAVKALSPGINDTSTAIAAVDAIGAALLRLATRRVEDPFRSEGGVLRLVARGPTFESLLAVGLDEIRRAAPGKVSIYARLLGALVPLARATGPGTRRALVVAHADRLLASARRSVDDAADLAEVVAAHARVLEAAGESARGSADGADQAAASRVG